MNGNEEDLRKIDVQVLYNDDMFYHASVKTDINEVSHCDISVKNRRSCYMSA